MDTAASPTTVSTCSSSAGDAKRPSGRHPGVGTMLGDSTGSPEREDTTGGIDYLTSVGDALRLS